jgi:hypothetical protein
VVNFAQTPSLNERILVMEGAMNDSKHYRSNAVDCLMVAQDACQPGNRGIHLSMASSWLSLALQDEAMDGLLSNWEVAKPIKK